MTSVQLNEKEIFTRHYATLCNTLTDVNNLLPHFVQRNIISTSDVEEINVITTAARKVEKLLSHISGPLTAGDPKGFHIMLTIMKEHGNQSTKDLAVKIMTSSNNSKMEHEVTNDNRHQQPSDTSHLHTSSPTKPAASSERPTVNTADPLSVQFSTFVATIEALLETCHDKLEQSKQICSNLTISDNSDELLFNDEQLQKINVCTTFRELFTILRKHWSWKEYSILTSIISIVGLKEAKDEVEIFQKRMASYQGMKLISEDIPYEAISHEYIRLSIIIDKPYREFSLENFTELQKFIFSNLDVKAHIALPFIKFLFNSLHLEWYVLKKAAPHMIKMAKQNEETFTSNSVVFIQINQFVVLDCKAKEVDDEIQTSDAKSSTDYRSGGYGYDFVDAPPDRLVCKICQLPCHETQQSECCGNIYCKCDIDQLKATTTAQPTCPICRSEDFITHPNLAIDRDVQQLMVYCPAKETTGCDWIGKLDDVDKHYSHGEECETECEKCTTTVKHKLLHSHLDTECPCYCPYCDMTAEREVISSEHKENCHKFPLTCPNNCGLDNIPRDNMDEHKKVCPLEMIQCEFHDVGCEVQFPRIDEECHVKENIIMHLHLTRLQLSIVNKKLEQVNTKHLNYTEEATKSLLEHQERVKVLESLFEDKQPLNKDILLNLLQSKSCVDAESQTDTSASEFKSEVKTTRQKLFTAYKNQIMWSIITIVIAILFLYVKSLRYYYMQDSPDLPSANDYHKNVSMVLYELIDKSTLPWPTKLHHWSSINNTIAPIVLKLPNFSKMKNSISYSEPFFAFQNGYKLCLKYYPNGFRDMDVGGHFMSIYLHLVKGPHDEIMEKNGYFPIKEDISIELLNPREDNDHVRVMLKSSCDYCNSCSSEWNKRITEVTINPSGCGFPKFISLGRYNFESNYQCVKGFSKTICDYLTSDDALYFRVRVLTV